MSTPKRIALLLAGGVVLTLALLPVLPLRAQTTLTENNADITYGVARRFVYTPGSCVTYFWDVQNIQAVRLNDRDAVGTDEATVCEVATPAVLRVDFTDGQVAFYYPQPVVLATHPAAQVAALVAVLLLVYAVTPPTLGGQVVRAVETTAVWLVVTFVLLEGSVRLWVLLAGTPADRIVYLGTPQDIVAANRDYIEMPFVDYGLSPLRGDVNRAGFRGGAFEIDKPAGEFRIVAMGGSTTYGDGLEADEAWPARLEATLRDTYGYDNVRVINAGVPAYTTTHSLVNFATRVVEIDPDMVFIYHGVNDARQALVTSADCYRGNNVALGIGTAPAWTFDAPPLGPSAFFRLVQLRLGLVANPNQQQDAVVFEQAANCDINGEPARSTAYYERNLRHLITLARANDVQPVLSTWAFAYSQQLDTPFESYAREALLFTPEINAVTRALAAELDVPLFDLAAALEPNLDYWREDIFHQSAAGSRRQAALYAAFLDEACLLAPC